jgi:NAD+ diphosphatase
MSKHGMAHHSTPPMMDDDDQQQQQHEPQIEPLYLSVDDIQIVLSQYEISLSDMMVPTDSTTKLFLLAWVGSYQGNDYWVIKVPPDLGELLPLGEWKPLREFGDRLERSVDAGILATANGLVEFHKSHGFCSFCGASTITTKAGASRKCTGSGCNRSVYPRLDVATIMLITSPCGNYALLGRKANWPQGRYSTLAGFAEVGETLEECCRRETFEESGVVVDPSSVSFVASQPWPFPRSLMVAFQARAKEDAGEEQGLAALPTIRVDKEEMEDIQWFSREYVRERLVGGSTALGYQPTVEEEEFHIPGRSSLARGLITKWVESEYKI